jgi:PST family polysaccharide transporter
VTPAAVEDIESIGRKAGRGLKWSLLGNMVTRIGSFAMGLILARLLTPSDFGMYAIALAATQFVMNVKDVGIITATVQWRGKLAEMAPTATTLAFVFSTVLYAIFWVAAPAFAGLAGDPAAAPVVRLLTAVILIEGVTAVRSGTLMREFRQDRLILANMVGLVVNATVAITMAAGGAGAYSFAGGQVAGAAVTGVLIFVFARVPVQIGLDFAVAAKLLRFGVPLAASLAVEAVLMNIQFMIIGRMLGPSELGFYLLAFNVSTWALSVISSAVRYVSVPGFSRLSEQDPDTLSAGVQRSLPLLVTSVVPIAVLTSALAPALVVVLYGGPWAEAAPALRFLMVLTVVRILVSFSLDILMGAGATRSTLWVNLGWAVAVIPALFVGTKVDGIRGAAIGHAVVGLVVAVPLAAWALHRAGVRLAPIAAAFVRPLVAGALAGVVALLVRHVAGTNSFVQLSLAGTAGVLAYVAVAVPRERLRQWLGAIRRQPAAATD